MSSSKALVYYWYPAMFSLLNDILKTSILNIITLRYPQTLALNDSITTESHFVLGAQDS